MTVRLAVAGAGLIGQRRIEEIDATPSATLAALVDPFPAAAEVKVLRPAVRRQRAHTQSVAGTPWKGLLSTRSRF